MLKKLFSVFLPVTPAVPPMLSLVIALAALVSCAATSAGSSAGVSGKGSPEVSPALSSPGTGGNTGGAFSGGAVIGGPVARGPVTGGASNTAGNTGAGDGGLLALEELAERERSGGFVPGLGLAESNIRERFGDYAGAVLAVYKELSWAYSMGAGSVSREAILGGLHKLLDPETVSRFPADAQNQNARAVTAISAFLDSRWDEAGKLLGSLYANDQEADSFSRWMILVCSLESGNAGRESRSAYASIRSRYASFPEYWYRGARAGNSNAGDYAERCINLAPSGPYAAECRIILAKLMGLSPSDAPAIKTRLEIESLVNVSVNQGNPELLAELLPLAGLPDNPSTLYAAGAMRALASEDLFRNWFVREAEKAQSRRAGSRLADRLLYISRG